MGRGEKAAEAEVKEEVRREGRQPERGERGRMKGASDQEWAWGKDAQTRV